MSRSSARLFPISLTRMLPGLLLLFASHAGATSRTWSGLGDATSWASAANWTPFDNHPQAGDDVLIDGGALVLLSSDTAVLGSFVITNATLTFTNWSTRLLATDVTIQSDGELTLPPAFLEGAFYTSNRVHVVCTSLTIAANGRIDADGKGYLYDQGPGKGELMSATGYSGGGGYGGRGGDGFNGTGGAAYGQTNHPSAPGSGGGSFQVAIPARLGGSGGGAIRLEVTGSLAIDGTISACGTGSGYAAGGGSGGSVWITCGTFGGSTNGLIQACGGDALFQSVATTGGGGGGGRIAVEYGALGAEHAVRLHTSVGSGWKDDDWADQHERAAERGTVWVSDTGLLSEQLKDGQFENVRLFMPVNEWGVSSLTVSNCSVIFGQDGFHLTVTNGLRVDAGGALGVGMPSGDERARIDVGQDLTLTNGGRLYVYAGATNGATDYGALVSVTGHMAIGSGSWACPYGHQTDGGGVLFAMSDLTVAAAGGINADGKGHEWDAGPGKGATIVWGGGGGYGGRGGDGGSAGAAGGTAYGASDAPTRGGSGGGSYVVAYPRTRGGFGGGLVRIAAGGTVALDGSLTARGGTGYHASGAGSGGAVSITCTTFGGQSTGLIDAEGGHVRSGQKGGAGGGGRIAVDYGSLAAAHAVRFSCTTGSGYAVATPGDPKMARLGTIHLSDTNMLSEALTAFDGRLDIPGFTSWSPDSLTVSNCLVDLGPDFQLDVTGDLVVRGSAGGLFAGPAADLRCGGDLALTNGGQLRVYAGPTNGTAGASGAFVGVTGTLAVGASSWIYPYSDGTNGGAPLFRVGSLTVASGGGFDAEGAGYLQDQGLGKSAAGVYTGGAGHGGKGGDGKSGTGGPTYGSSNAPVESGSGGGSYLVATVHQRGGHGGGVVRVVSASDITLDGTINVDGADAYNASGGGSGGSVFLACQAFTGAASGRMSSDGGNFNNQSGGGGGGRIAVAIGLAEADLATLLSGATVGGLSVYKTHVPYAGSITVTNGTSYYPPPDVRAPDPGEHWFMTKAYTLTVVGSPAEYDTPTPNDYGTHVDIAVGAWVTNSITTPVNEGGGLRRTCFGWDLRNTLGGTVSGGPPSQAVFQLSTNLVLTWMWTNEFELAVSAAANGQVNSGVVNGWYTNGLVVTNLVATPDGGYTFSLWTGDVPSGQEAVNPLTVTMDQARTLTANFSSSSAQTNAWTGVGAWESVTNWSLGAMPSTLDTAVIQAGQVVLGQSRGVNALVVDSGATLVFTNWTTILAASNVTIAGTVTAAGPSSGALSSNRIQVVCTNLTVEADGVVHADGCGFGPDEGLGTGNPYTSGYPGGAGHGGRGGSGYYAFGGGTYGSLTRPELPGSGGASYQTGNPANRGGPGGGVIRLIVAEGLTVHGTIGADGGVTGYASGGGAGGSVWLTCHTFSGSTSGLIRARGGAGDAVNVWAGGGGGGRLAVDYAAVGAEHAVRFAAGPGAGQYTNDWGHQWQLASGVGTLNLPDTALLSPTLVDGHFQRVQVSVGTNRWAPDSLVVSNCSIRFPDEAFQLVVTDDVRIDAGGALGVGPADGGSAPALIEVGGDLAVTNGGRLYVYSGTTNGGAGPDYGARIAVTGALNIGAASWIHPFAHTTNGAGVLIRAASVRVEAGGGISADAQGFGYANGPGSGGGAPNGYSGGGGHGGWGGEGSQAEGGSANGSASDPLLPGSGGGIYRLDVPKNVCGHGGGVIRIETLTLTVDGTLSADGGLGGNASGGGAGGSVSIRCTQLGGASTGVIRARGGDGTGGSTGSGGGGGGRIALDYTSLSAVHDFGLSALAGQTFWLPTAGDWHAARMGTLYLPDTNLLSTSLSVFDGRLEIPGFTNWTIPSLTLENATLEFPGGFRLDVAGDVLISGSSGALLMGTGSVMTCGGDLTVTNSAQLRVYAGPTNGLAADYGARVTVAGTLRVEDDSWVCPYADGSDGGAPLFQVESLVVDRFGGFNADGAGFEKESGPGAGADGVYSGGGGHGGGGGDGRTQPGGPANDSSNAPVWPGSGGGTYVYNTPSQEGGPGGGVIRVEAAGSVVMDGTLTANGRRARNASGGGAGGAIFLNCGSFEGSFLGLVSADGGNGVNEGGGGGGGRIGIWYGVPAADWGRVKAGDLRRAIVTSTYSGFPGTRSVDGGAAGGGLSQAGGVGSVVFLTMEPKSGTVFIVR